MAKKARWDGGDVVIDDKGTRFKVGWYKQHPVSSAAARGGLRGMRRGDRVSIELVDEKKAKGDVVRPRMNRVRIL